jgi:DNA-3-methyladenine glycosylase II
MARSRHREASLALAVLDPTMAALVEQHGPMRLPAPAPVDHRFEQLAESIAYQQLAGRAAATIWGRVRALYGPGPLEPAAVLLTPTADLRAAGLSGAKTAAILDLAGHAADGALELDRMGRMDDGAVVEQLVQVRGIGPWTAQMFLIFTLQRLDVWPTGDYGVRSGFGLAYGLSEPPSANDLEALGDRFRPYRSVAAWYCWRAADSPN